MVMSQSPYRSPEPVKFRVLSTMARSSRRVAVNWVKSEANEQKLQLASHGCISMPICPKMTPAFCVRWRMRYPPAARIANASSDTSSHFRRSTSSFLLMRLPSMALLMMRLMSAFIVSFSFAPVRCVSYMT